MILHDCGTGATDEDVQCSVWEGDEGGGKKEQENGGKGDVFYADADTGVLSFQRQLDNSKVQVEGKVIHLRSFVEGLKEEERQVEENLEGIRKTTIAQMRVIILYV